ncbi:MAG: ankyrin repeat domain-containing protein [Planctomycetes bacterium]|nr:ankyrin repeat domain-containing protein [Planctomycetota bacterium]
MVSQKFFSACSTGKLEVVKGFLDNGVDPDARDKYGLTGLMWTGRKGHVQVAQLLLSRGAGIELGDANRRTALFHGVTFQRYELVKFLAQQGANVSPVDYHDWTPLDFSRTSGHKKMVALLEALGGLGRYTEGKSQPKQKKAVTSIEKLSHFLKRSKGRPPRYRGGSDGCKRHGPGGPCY